MDAEKELMRAKHDCLRWLKGFHNVNQRWVSTLISVATT